MASDNNQNILGYNSADNKYDSSSVASNADGSIIERLEAVQQALLVDGTSNPIGVNDADNAFDSSLVVANEDGSVLERLEQMQEAVNKGTGTALAANKSLVDAIGSDGNALTDSATSVVGILGVNDADNAFDSTNVVANRDGSVLERTEFIMDRVYAGKQFATKTISTLAGGDDNLFDFTGSIRIHSIIGRVTTVIQAQATTLKLQAICDALADYDICGTVDANAFAVGTLLSITGTAANGMVGATGVGAIAPGQANPVDVTCVTSGVINLVSGAASTGDIVWEILWEPLSSGATVTAS